MGTWQTRGYKAVTGVEALSNYQLKLTFETGEVRIFDMSPHLERGRFCELIDPKIFQSVRVCFNSVAWANGLDYDPEDLYAGSVPVHGE